MGKKDQKRIPSFPAAFTLIELLVVISIISMLLSILLPSLREAKEHGRRVVCQTNLHQLMLAWNLYAMDHDDRICSASIHYNGPRPWLNETSCQYPPNAWVSEGDGAAFNPVIGTETALQKGVLWPFLEVPEVYKCHSHQTDYFLSYSISHSMAANLRYAHESLFYSASEIPTPANKLVFIDSIGIRLLENQDYPQIFDLELHGFLPVDTSNGKWMPCSKLATRHSGGTNTAFADLHCGYLRYRDFRTMFYDDGRITVPMTGSEAENPDFETLYNICKPRGAAALP